MQVCGRRWMSSVSMEKIKELRAKTDAPMMDCKKALEAEGNDISKAIEWLRKKGITAAAARSNKIAAEGVIGACNTDTIGLIAEVNCETDFVARNEKFQNFVKRFIAANFDQVEHTDFKIREIHIENALKKELPVLNPEDSRAIGADALTDLFSSLRENLQVRRLSLACVPQGEGVVASYIHAALTKNQGRIGSLVVVKSKGDPEKLKQLAFNLAMHVVATKPLFLTRETVSPEALEKEKLILREQALQSGKPENVVDKVVEGRLSKYYEQVVLLEQPFALDEGKKKVKKAITEVSKDIGADIEVTDFVRFQLGET